jgi:glyoxylase-like metal-dependent hydrolase (beta-lactamase superfamily II)
MKLFVRSEYQDEPQRTRSSVQRILESLAPDILCPGHGRPLTHGVAKALEAALREDPEHLSGIQST